METNKKKIRGFELVREDMRKNKVKCILLPKRSTKHSAGYDFFLPRNVSILPHDSAFVWADVKAYMQEDEVLLLHIRSSIGKRGIILSNCTGIIDSDYYSNHTNDGNIGIMLRNMTDEVVELMGGEKIMQGIFTKYLIAYNDNATEERIGGIGSTGKGN